jgi:acyl-CoA thioesterase
MSDETGTSEADLLARRCAAAMYDRDQASRHLGMRIVDVAAGRATLRMRVTETMINGHGICHGGYVVLLADSAFAFACNTANLRTVAQGLDVVFLAAVHAGAELEAAAVRRSQRGRSGVYDVTVRRLGTSDADEIVAELRGRSRTISGTILAEE